MYIRIYTYYCRGIRALARRGRGGAGWKMGEGGGFGAGSLGCDGLPLSPRSAGLRCAVLHPPLHPGTSYDEY